MAIYKIERLEKMSAINKVYYNVKALSTEDAINKLRDNPSKYKRLIESSEIDDNHPLMFSYNGGRTWEVNYE